ncbi:MAG: hypothetical protein II180_06650, partial [Proteobacteria bacterium]|nr:hypothetical protein [Pseudomonadota bacterium]
ANVHIAAYASECDSAPSPTPMSSTAHTSSSDAGELCDEAVKAKFQKDPCKAYDLYKKAKKAGIKNPTCQKAADAHIAAYAYKCQ